MPFLDVRELGDKIYIICCNCNLTPYFVQNCYVILGKKDKLWIQEKVVRNWLIEVLIENTIPMIGSWQLSFLWIPTVFIVPTDLFLYSYEADSMLNFLKKNKRKLAYFMFLFHFPLYGWYYISELFWRCGIYFFY
jgi:hypothetical protein